MSAISSAVEHYLDTVGVTGSIPVSRTESSQEDLWQAHACPADVAQLVAHHLAKVRVASSSLVIRSKYIRVLWRKLHGGLVEWLGNGLQNRVHGFDSRIHLQAAIALRD